MPKTVFFMKKVQKSLKDFKNKIKLKTPCKPSKQAGLRDFERD